MGTAASVRVERGARSGLAWRGVARCGWNGEGRDELLSTLRLATPTEGRKAQGWVALCIAQWCRVVLPDLILTR